MKGFELASKEGYPKPVGSLENRPRVLFCFFSDPDPVETAADDDDKEEPLHLDRFLDLDPPESDPSKLISKPLLSNLAILNNLLLV